MTTQTESRHATVGTLCILVLSLFVVASGVSNVRRLWQETILHDFARSPDGEAPDAPLTIGPNGAIFGTTIRGGTNTCLYFSSVGCGTVFRVDQ